MAPDRAHASARADATARPPGFFAARPPEGLETVNRRVADAMPVDELAATV
jgi:hypothetical protein